MELRAKERYGVRIMADIARNDSEFVSITDISARQDISLKFVEKIVASLKKAQLLTSKQGVNGGYKLSKSADSISIKEIFSAVGENVQLVKCVTNDCPHSQNCDTREVWNKLNSLIDTYLNKITLQDLITKN